MSKTGCCPRLYETNTRFVRHENISAPASPHDMQCKTLSRAVQCRLETFSFLIFATIFANFADYVRAASKTSYPTPKRSAIPRFLLQATTEYPVSIPCVKFCHHIDAAKCQRAYCDARARGFSGPRHDWRGSGRSSGKSNLGEFG